VSHLYLGQSKIKFARIHSYPQRRSCCTGCGVGAVLTVVSEIERLREEAWIGDAVLALFVRDWLLDLN